MKQLRGANVAAVNPVVIRHPGARVSHGAWIPREPADFEYGERQYQAEDVALKEWGGTTS